jgi:two-component system chemotaxis response regulator CheB
MEAEVQMQERINVLIVDDSAVVRQTMQDILSHDPEIRVMGMAADPIIAAQKMREARPDVILLDVEMPRMDGITFLQKLMSQHPIPVVICSSLTQQNSETTFKALEYGAVEIIAKPKIGTKQFLEESRVRICDTVKAAFLSKVRKAAAPITVAPKLTADAILAKPVSSKAMVETTEKVIVVGASTGGTEALKDLLEMLPQDSPGVVIVQHMPEHFTRAFANRLDSICRISVKEAEENDTVIRGRALIAPGNRHCLLKRSGARYYVEVKDGPLVSRHRPDRKSVV